MCVFLVTTSLFGGFMILIKSKLSKGVQNWTKKFQERLYWGAYIYLFLEGFLVLGVSSLLELKKLTVINFNIGYDMIIGGIILGAIIIGPFAIGIYLFFQVRSANFMQKYGPIFLEINPQQSSALLYNLIFCLRRLVFCITATLASDYSGIQIVVYMACSLFHLEYLTLTQPFQKQSDNMIEIFNECCILAMSYTITLFSNEYVPNSNVWYKTGWVVIAIFAANTAVNILYISISTWKKVLPKLSKQFKKNKAATKAPNNTKIKQSKQSSTKYNILASQGFLPSDSLGRDKLFQDRQFKQIDNPSPDRRYSSESSIQQPQSEAKPIQKQGSFSSIGEPNFAPLFGLPHNLDRVEKKIDNIQPKKKHRKKQRLNSIKRSPLKKGSFIDDDMPEAYDLTSMNQPYANRSNNANSISDFENMDNDPLEHFPYDFEQKRQGQPNKE